MSLILDPAQHVWVPSLPEICERISQSCPAFYTGDARIRHLVQQMEGLSEDELQAFHAYFSWYLDQMIELGASDMDLGGPACHGRAWFRVDGELRPLSAMEPVNMHALDVLLVGILNAYQLEELYRDLSVDFSYERWVPGESTPRRFRANLYYDLGHLAITVRAITQELRPLKSLGFHPAIERGLMFRHVRDGLTLVTGVTGSGKSTTLDAIVDANNHDVHAHVVIIAKPIEYVHTSHRCLIRHREVGRDVRSFKEGIVQALRQDPDIVIIGEMRDPDTISTALEITDSGHKVFSTLHTSSAVESIDRIIAEYPAIEQDRVRNRLADVLRCIISQKLCPAIGGGRVLAKEVLWVTPSVRAAIKNGNTGEIYQMIWEGVKMGQHTLEQDLFRLLQKNLITRETALSYANNKRRLMQLLR